ncbi:MAG TPA: hypothetical protein VKX17_04655 [Planctomycetota bacterium]|nr:hypothetical protein [Planctomycetota bacterium]
MDTRDGREDFSGSASVPSGASTDSNSQLNVGVRGDAGRLEAGGTDARRRDAGGTQSGRGEAGGTQSGRLEAGGTNAGAPRNFGGTGPRFASERERRRYEMMEWQDQAADDLAYETGICFGDAKVLVEAKYTAEMVPKSAAQRRMLLDYLRRNTYGAPPAWQWVSGLDEKLDISLAERRKRLRHLIEAVKLHIRMGLAAYEEDPDYKDCTVYWEPITAVCRAFGIAQSALSRFCVELNGMNLKGVVDSVRGEGIINRMRGEVREFLIQNTKFKIQNEKLRMQNADAGSGGRVEVRAGGLEANAVPPKGGTTNEDAQCATFARDEEEVSSHREDAWAVWKDLKASRKAPVFSRETWAQGYGFSSYIRMYKACKVVYEMTPQQLEMTLIEEALRLSEKNERKECSLRSQKLAGGTPAVQYLMGKLAEKVLGKEFKEWNRAELEAAIKGYRGFDAILQEEREKMWATA